MSDPTEELRRQQQVVVNADQRARTELEREYGQCWNTEELRRDFEVIGFAAPYVVVRRRSDNQKGTLTFRHDPRLYYDFSST